MLVKDKIDKYEKKIKLYHGTNNRDIEQFKIIYREENPPDFGAGLYFTSNFEQAKQWSCSKSNIGAIYEIDIYLDSLIGKNLNNDELFYYLSYLCRIDLENLVDECLNELNNVDYVYGKMLKEINNFKSIAEKFNSDDISFEEFKNATKFYDNSMNQYCFRTRKAVDIINKSITKKYLTKKEGKIIIIENIDEL